MANLIRALLAIKGYNPKSFAKETGLDYQAFRRRVNNPNMFSLEEINFLVSKLKLTPEEVLKYFFNDVFQFEQHLL